MFIKDWTGTENYFSALRIFSSLSRLFSESEIPYLDYRLAENIFCRYFDADNCARDCTAYDAKIGNTGIGIKTFILKNDGSSEKIAEFNRLRPELDNLKGDNLAVKLAEFRNGRIETADRLYGISSGLYHIVGRKENQLCIFNTPYRTIDIDSICVQNVNETGIHFRDKNSEYRFSRSKSVLMMRFNVPNEYRTVDIDILKDPYDTLLEFFENRGVITDSVEKPLRRGTDYVILPLYSTRTGSVPERSGLNQWNAEGRTRDCNEIYIPIPSALRSSFPDFFPPRDTHFTLRLPDGNSLRAKVCQDGGKALMTDPNKDLGEWLLRKVMKKPEGVLVVKEDFDRLGFDSVCIKKLYQRDNEGREVFSISVTESEYESYSDFISF